MKYCVSILVLCAVMMLMMLIVFWAADYFNYRDAWKIDDASIPLTFDEFRQYYEDESGDWYLEGTYALYKDHVVIMKSYLNYRKYHKFFLQVLEDEENEPREMAIAWFNEQFSQ